MKDEFTHPSWLPYFLLTQTLKIEMVAKSSEIDEIDEGSRQGKRGTTNDQRTA